MMLGTILPDWAIVDQFFKYRQELAQAEEWTTQTRQGLSSVRDTWVIHRRV